MSASTIVSAWIATIVVAPLAAGQDVLTATAVPPASRAEKAPMVPVRLEIVLHKKEYVFQGGGRSPAEYRRHLEIIADKLRRGEEATPPPPLDIDLVLRLTNTSNQPVTIYIGGDPNIYTFTLRGDAGVVTMNNPVAFTTDFRPPKPVRLEPRKYVDIPVKKLADGTRGFSRLLFWTGPGTYTLAAEYKVAFDETGGATATLKSDPVTITVKGK